MNNTSLPRAVLLVKIKTGFGYQIIRAFKYASLTKLEIALILVQTARHTSATSVSKTVTAQPLAEQKSLLLVIQKPVVKVRAKVRAKAEVGVDNHS